MRQWWAKIRALLRGRPALSSDLREELQAHFDMEVEENLARGMSPGEARRRACERFGNPTFIHERARDTWTFPSIENLGKDAAYAARMARRSPGFTSIAVLTIALGIGGVTSMFSVIRTVLLKPLDYPDPHRIVKIQGPFNRIRYLGMQTATAFSGFGAAGIPESVTIDTRGGEPESLQEARVSANFLYVLGVAPMLGRGFAAADDRPGGPDVALISYSLWERLFGGDAKIVGRAISLNARSYTVVGVLPPHFEFPQAGYDVWVTRPWEWSTVAPELWDRVPDLWGFARLKSRATLAEAVTQLNALTRAYALAYPGLPGADPHLTVHVEPLEESIVRGVRSLLWILFYALGFVLLIVCANVAGLLLARSAARSREFAVRAALGASRRRLIQQMLAESVLLALAGAALGILLARGILFVMTRFGPVDLPRADEIRIDSTVFAFACAVSVIAGLVFGLLPSLRFSRPALAGFLREHGALAGRTTGGRTAFGFGARGALVVAQIALCIVLMVAASLTLQSFLRLRSVDPGFQPSRLLTMEIALPKARYGTDREKQAFWDELLRRVGALPGVLNAAVAASIPSTIPNMMVTQVQEQPLLEVNDRPVVNIQSATPSYFQTMTIPLRAGRTFSVTDRAGAPRVAVINERLARLFWPSYPQGPSPVGQHLLAGGRSTPVEIVGVAGDVHEDALAADVKPEAYFPSAQLPPQTAYLAVRTSTNTRDLDTAVRSQVTAMDPGQSVSHVQTMDQLLSASLGGRRLTLVLIAAFAGIALVIAMIGIYGVMSFLVVERTQEFGIRQALGAQRRDIMALVLGRGLRLVSAGLCFGILGALASARFLGTLLFHANAADPRMYGAVAILFAAISLVACCLPAIRATRADAAPLLR